MRFGSLFAGIGGLDLGLERAGMECVWQVEIDDYCTRILEKHWPNVRRYRNVREVGSNLEPVDLIAGGFPCQPHSVAGKQLGEKDDRNLWPEFIRVIRETKPRYVLAENVPGIVTTYLDTVLSDLEGEDYTCTTFNLPACGFDAPHRRERIFVVAYSISRGSQERWPEGTRSMERSAKTRKASGDNISATSQPSSNVPDSPPMQRPPIKRDEQDRVLPEVLADSPSERLERKESERGKRRQSRLSTERGWWTVEPDVGRVAYGIPSRVDRLRGLGNAVVPQVAQWIGERIMEHATAQQT